jgi:hypothetical protein
MRSLSLRVAEDPGQPLDRLVTIAVEASAEVGVNSALSQRLHHRHRGGVLAGLNIYSGAPDASTAWLTEVVGGWASPARTPTAGSPTWRPRSRTPEP